MSKPNNAVAPAQTAPKPVAAVHEPALPEPVARRGITEAQWRTLANNLYPGADSNSVLMVWDYCVARRLDPLKKPCHIVPMSVKDAKTGEYRYRDVVMPGIYELRTTAQRTGEYLGHSRPEYGETIDHAGVSAPEWCELTVYRWHGKSGQRIEFPVRVLFREAVATKKDGKANDRWGRAPIQMLTKCAEAAGLREAFPDEIGGEHTAEEMDGRTIEVTPEKPVGKPRTEAPRARTPAIETESHPDPALDAHVPQYDEAAAVAALKAAESVEQLDAAWGAICEDYRLSGRELPVSVEAVRNDRRDALAHG